MGYYGWDMISFISQNGWNEKKFSLEDLNII